MNSRPLRQIALYTALAAAALLWNLSPLSASIDPRSFEVATWNMQWFPSGYPEPQTPQDEAKRLTAATRFMRKHGVPDILMTQEIRDSVVCTNLAEKLNDTLFKTVVCSSFIDYETNAPALQQLAIFSRFEAVVSGSEPWHASDFVFPPRGYVYAVFNIHGTLVACFNVHLKSNYIPEDQDVKQQTSLNRLKRELSSRQLLAHIDRMRRDGLYGTNITQFIIAGDFNTSLTDDRYAKEKTVRSLLKAGFTNAFENLTGDEYASLPATRYYPAATFDYILAQGSATAGKPRVLPSSWISDHRMLQARFVPRGTPSSEATKASSVAP